MIKGKNPILLNTTYLRPSPENDWKDQFEVIYKTENGEVHRTVEPGEADIFIVKEECRDFNYNKPQERMERMDKVRVPISKIRQKIAESMGDEGKAFYKACVERRDFKALDQLYKWPYAFACDFQPEYYYYKNWYEKYNLSNVKLTKAFIDIETDLMDYTLDMDDIPNTAQSPVNLITIILEDSKEAFTMILKPYEPSKLGRSPKEYDERYALYEKQLKDHQYLMSHLDDFIKDLHESFDPTYGHLDYHLIDFDQEIDLIAYAFHILNVKKPNFCLIWNMRFDIQYLLYRIRELGYDPRTIMCHKDFGDISKRRCSFRVDKSTYQLEKQYDFFYCSSYTQFICQMRLYASIRKSQHKLRSVALNAIGDRELRDRKVEYPEEANIVRFPYMDWPRFVKYNIKDVLIQLGIERKTNDLMTYYMKSHANLTPYNKIFKETHLLRNVREMYFEKDGWVQGNNVNIIDYRNPEQADGFYGSDDEEDGQSSKTSFKGAINADPLWNDRVGLEVLGAPSNNMFQNSMDYDMGAFYPSIKIASNMDPGTLLFKAAFINDEFISGEFPNRSLNTTYQEKDKNNQLRDLDITGEAVNTFASGNILTFGYNYLGLPDLPTLIDEVVSMLAG
ncbi:MAG: hypothetical protein NC548_13145 [Lachnospiraceae bacterium]|nr:hypothetical protein [Lachnospiraceae bacterium]MCM1230664.1 hypothetical protein [Ruminococcus flavefaciens]